MKFHASLQSVTEVEYKSKVFTQQKAPDIAPSQASCGVSFVTSYNGMPRVETRGSEKEEESKQRC